jgi:ferrochelatase
MILEPWMRVAYLLVNFGGPRNLDEIEGFLVELLTDREVIRTRLPSWLHRLVFKRIAKKRVPRITPDYALIGGKSPIFEDTESVAASVGEKLESKVLTFHRYLPQTHPGFLEKMEDLRDVDTIHVVPMFPQFSYSTTGSIALWLSRHLSLSMVTKLRWIRSYPEHSSYIRVVERCLREFLMENNLKEEETLLLFSAHGLPKSYVDTGDPYEKECRLSFDQIRQRFPKALSKISFQSQFGREEWIRPYTIEVCRRIGDHAEGRRNVVLFPLSFTSDHIETLYEIEHLYLQEIRKGGFHAVRCPALNRRIYWIDFLAELFTQEEGLPNSRLIREGSIL